MDDIKSIIKQVADKTSIIDVASRYTQLKPTGNKYSAKCPFHDDNNPSLIIYPETNSWFCFGCQVGGSVFDFVMRAEKITFYESLKKLAEPFHIEIGDKRNFKPYEVEEYKKDKLDKLLRSLMLYFLKNPYKAREYLENKRGIRLQTAKAFRVGWSNLKDTDSLINYLVSTGFTVDECKYYPFLDGKLFFNESAIYPAIDTKGRIFNLISGSVNGREPKYMFLKGQPKGIFNLHKVLFTEGKVYITEGVLDCLSLEQQGLNAVATLGVHLSEEAKNELLLLKGREIVIAYDNDEAGITGAFNIASLFPTTKILTWPVSSIEDKVDPNSYFANHTLADFLKLEEQDGLDFSVEYILKLPADKRTNSIKTLFPVIKSRDVIEQAHYQKIFEKQLNIKKQQFSALINDIDITEIEDNDKRGTVIEILDKQFSFISPALDFIDAKAYVTVPLPVKVRIKDKEIIESRNYAITSNRERFELTQHNLFQRRLFAHNIDATLPKRWSSDAINQFLKGESSVTINTAFNQIKDHLKETIELVNDNYYSLVSLWIIGTYFHKLFNCYGFLFCNGVKESGKTKFLTICSLLSFNGVLTSNISPSSIFRSIDAEHCSLFIDEIENLGRTDLQELRSVLLGSYKQGATVKRSEMVSNKIRVVNYQTYSPKGLGNISGADDVIISRSIPVPMFRSMNSQIVNNEILMTDKIYQQIRDTLYLCLMSNFKAVQNAYDKLESKDFKGRFWEITKPILTISKLVDQQTYENIYSFLRELQDERDKNNYSLDLDSKVVLTIANLLRENKDFENKLLIDAKSIIKYFKNTEDDELAYIQSVQLGKVLNRLGLHSGKKIKVMRGKHTLVYEFEVERVKTMAERLRLKVYL